MPGVGESESDAAAGDYFAAADCVFAAACAREKSAPARPQPSTATAPPLPPSTAYTRLLARNPMGRLRKASESLVRCFKCNGSSILWNIKQTRSADEGSTLFFLCRTCNHRWRSSA